MTLETIGRVLKATHEAVEGKYTIHRCLLTTAVLRELFKEEGYSVELFPCSVNGFSAALIELMNEHGEGVHQYIQENQEEVLSRGAKFVSVRANTPEAAPTVKLDKPLMGHIALLVKNRDGVWLVDGSFIQFKRTKEDHGWVLNAPDYAAIKLDNATFAEVKRRNAMASQKTRHLPDLPVKFYLECGGFFEFVYERLQQLDAIEHRPRSQEFKTSDLNMKKHADLMKEIRTALKGE